MQNIFTLEELLQIKKEYISNEEDSYFLCDESPTFCGAYQSNDRTRVLIVQLARTFLSETSKWDTLFSVQGYLYLFYDLEIPSNLNNLQRRKVRIEFLDWLIENTELFDKAKSYILNGGDIKIIETKYNLTEEVKQKLTKK